MVTHTVVRRYSESVRRYALGMVLKSWTSTQEEHVDPICQDLEYGQQPPMEKPFEVIVLRFHAPPAHAGCRCLTEIYRVAA